MSKMNKTAREAQTCAVKIQESHLRPRTGARRGGTGRGVPARVDSARTRWFHTPNVRHGEGQWQVDDEKKFEKQFRGSDRLLVYGQRKETRTEGETHREAEVESKHGRATQRELRDERQKRACGSSGGLMNFLSPVESPPQPAAAVDRPSCSAVPCALAIMASAELQSTFLGTEGMPFIDKCMQYDVLCFGRAIV